MTDNEKKEITKDKDLGINVVKDRNFQGSLEQANDELCDAYMIYKDLASRCTIDFENVQSMGLLDADDASEGGAPGVQSSETVIQNKDQEIKVPDNYSESESGAFGAGVRASEIKRKKVKVFYFKPESFMMEEPDKQRQFRDKLMSRIRAVPSLSQPRLMADDLQESRTETVADRSDPREMRKVLATYFQRKQYALQHKKYKLLSRWAHHAIRTRNIEAIGQQATFRCSKLQWEIDNSIKRAQRLAVDDDFTLGSNPDLRPTSKAKKNEGTLYVEIKDLPAQSCIRSDDIEVYTRHITYEGKINKLVNKFIAKLKWLPMSQRYEVFESVVAKYFAIRDENIQKQRDILDKIETETKARHLETQQLFDDLRKIRSDAHVTQYDKSMFDQRQRIIGACRPDYEIPPDLVKNTPEIKMKIKELADKYALSAADLEQDNGFSFAYQLTLFFPTEFQKQVIKSEFSIYDAFAGQNDDQNQLKKRNFSSMLRVDPAIFRDIATNSNLIPGEDSIADEVARLNIKIIRLKASPWIEHVICLPKIPDWQRKQDARLGSEDNPIDTLLRGALDFLDVNDPASVNLVIAEASQIHLDLIQKQQLVEDHAKKSKVFKKVQTTNQQRAADDSAQEPAVEELVYSTVSATNIQELNNNMYVQMSNALTGSNLREFNSGKSPQDNAESKRKQHDNKSGLFNLQQHLVQSHNTLRYMDSRDAKTKLLYSLNYFRSIQKRLMLDLREFGTRERVLGDVTDPLIPAQEADPQIVDTLNIVLSNANNAMKAAEAGRPAEGTSGARKDSQNLQDEGTTKQSNGNSNRSRAGNNRSRAESQFSPSHSPSMKRLIESRRAAGAGVSLVDIKKIRLAGKFHEKHLSTCPTMPRFHATFGEPSEIQGEFVQNDRDQEEVYISRDAMKLSNRIDHIEIAEDRQEVHVKDDFSIYIMYECTLTDMQILEEELLRIGSFYIAKTEELYDTEVDQVCHKKDRQQVMNDLLNCEMHFQFRKVLLTQLYMECYEHICDSVEQQRLIQLVVDTMARRPRLNLESLYFKDSYRAEIECIDRNIELLDIIVQNQIKLEKLENTHLHESLNLSYSLAQKKQKDGWSYTDADQYLAHLIGKFQSMPAGAEQQDTQRTGQSDAQRSSVASTRDEASKPQAETKQRISDFEKPGYQMRNLRYTDCELDTDAFTKLLGLPKVTLEQLFNQSRENDEVAQDIMAEQSHFQTLLEGYPDLMSLKQSGRAQDFRNYRDASHHGSRPRGQTGAESLSQPNQDDQHTHSDQVREITLQLNKWLKRSEAMSIMDFYSDSLSFVTKLQATISSCMSELIDVLKPHDNMMHSLLEAEVYEQALKQYRTMQRFLMGEQVESVGHQYLESEFVVGSSDKMMFCIKDLTSELSHCAKASLNPFLVAKLDIPSIKIFPFPLRVTREQNPYYLKRDGMLEGKPVSICLAEQKLHDPTQFYKEYVREFDKDQLAASFKDAPTKLKINVPTLLTLQCNAAELLRLRRELMMCLSECIELQKLYKRQVAACDRASWQPLSSDSLAFEHGLLADDEINFVDDGPASMIEIELAVNEIDPVMASNMNFRNQDAFKMMITNSGLEEVRMVLHYQMMQKQALIVATRSNQILMDVHLRAEKELTLVQSGRALPNMVIELNQLFSRIADGVDQMNFGRVKSAFATNLTNNVSGNLVSVGGWKSTSRTSLGRKYQEMLAKCEKHHRQKEVKLRICRSYKVSLINQYCNQVLENVYADSIKYNIVSQCQKLRALNQYFQFNPSLMNVQTPENDNHPKFARLFNLETSDLFENYFDWYSPSRFQRELESHQKKNASKEAAESGEGGSALTATPAKPPKIEAFDGKKRHMLDVLSIPSTHNLMQFDIFSSSEEKSLFLKSSLNDVQIDWDNPHVEGTQLYDQILPNFKDIQPAEEITKNDQHLPPRRASIDFNKIQATQIFQYFCHIENIIALELSISKFSFHSASVIEMDHCIQNGMPFFQNSEAQAVCMNDDTAILNSGKAPPDVGLAQTGQKIKENEDRSQIGQNQRNILASKILNKIVQKKRLKSDIGEELFAVAQKIQKIMKEAQKHGEKQNGTKSFSCEYLAQYEQIRYLQVVSTILRLSEQFYKKHQIQAGQALNDTLLALAKRDHIKILSSDGSFHLNSADLDVNNSKIESSSLSPHFGSISEQRNFKKCIFPILSDKALEPAEITLLESIYLSHPSESAPLVSRSRHQEGGNLDSPQRSPTSTVQYAGSAHLAKPFIGTDLQPLQTYLLCMKNSQRQYISSNLKSMQSLLEDYLIHIVQENVKEGQEVLSFAHLKKSKTFLREQIKAQQLKQAILCFMGHEVPSKLNADKQRRKQIQDMYTKQFFWKILEEKDVLKQAQEADFRTTMSQEELKEAQRNLEQEIYRLQKIDERKITDEDMSRAQKLKIKALEEEHKVMKRNVLMDSILTSRAEIMIIQAEIERSLIEAAVRTLDAESLALANCLKNQSKEIDAWVHPFQQFAVTLYDKVDPTSHLDAISKCAHIQQFMTRLKNRGTEVETLTSGTGYVFTLKDINDCVATLSKGILKYAEQELRSRCETFAKKEQHYLDLLYVKDQQIGSLERRLEEQVRVIDKMVNSRMYEKGNKIVYELDQANRSLKLLKDNMHLMETQIRTEIDCQFRNKLNHRETVLFKEMRKFNDFKKDFVSTMNAGVVEDQENIKKMIAEKASQFRNLDSGSPAKYPLPRPGEQGDTTKIIGLQTQLTAAQKAKRRVTGQLDSKRYQNMKSMKPQGKDPHLEQSDGGPDRSLTGPYEFPKALQDIYQMDEAEAREELALLCDRTRLMFVFWKVKEITMKQRYENRLLDLNQKLSSNSMLWEQLAEAEKRETILRQELVLTQQGLSNCEKVVEKQRDHIKKLDTEKVRLQNFKQNKGRRLDELEKKVAQYEIFEKINVEKLIAVLNKQQNELFSLRNDSKNFKYEAHHVQQRQQEELKQAHAKFMQENFVKNQAIEKLETMRQEIKALEHSTGSISTVWREKCQELYHICLRMKEDNEYLTERVRQLADLAVGLMNKLQEEQLKNQSTQAKDRQGEDPQQQEDTMVTKDHKNPSHSSAIPKQQLQGSFSKLTQRRQSREGNTMIGASGQKIRASLPKLMTSQQQIMGGHLGIFGGGRNDPNLLRSSMRFDPQQQRSAMLLEASNLASSPTGSNDYVAKKSHGMAKGGGGTRKGAGYHSRGRSLLDIKNDFEKSQISKNSAEKSPPSQNLIFGRSTKLEPNHQDSTDVSNNYELFGSKQHGKSAKFGDRNSKQDAREALSKDLRDSLLDDRFGYREKPTRHVGGGSSVINRGNGIAGILGVGAQLPGLLSSKQSNAKNIGNFNHALQNNSSSTRSNLKRRDNLTHGNQDSFYNLKAQLGLHNLYPSATEQTDQATRLGLVGSQELGTVKQPGHAGPGAAGHQPPAAMPNMPSGPAGPHLVMATPPDHWPGSPGYQLSPNPAAHFDVPAHGGQLLSDKTIAARSANTGVSPAASPHFSPSNDRRGSPPH